MICEAPRCVKIRVKRTNEPQSCVQSIIFSSINDIFSEKVNTCFTIHDKWKVYFYNYLIVIFFLHGMAVLLMEKLLSNDCVECEKTRFSFRISASLSENVVASLQRKWFVAEWGAFPALKAWTISFLCYSIRNWLFFAPTFRGTSCPDLALTIKISSTRKNGAILASLKDALIRRYHLSVLSCFTVLYGASIILWKKTSTTTGWVTSLLFFIAFKWENSATWVTASASSFWKSFCSRPEHESCLSGLFCSLWVSLFSMTKHSFWTIWSCSISEALMSLWFVDVLKFSGASSKCEGAKHLFIHQIFSVDKHEERGLAFVSLIA